MPSRSTVSHRRTTLMASAVAVIAAALTGTGRYGRSTLGCGADHAHPGRVHTGDVHLRLRLHPRDRGSSPLRPRGEARRPRRPAGALQLPAADGNLRCYGPDQIRNAYDIQPLLDKGVTGKGRTIVIVDAFNPPNVQAELDTFTTTWHLPKARLRVVNPFGAGYDEQRPEPAGLGRGDRARHAVGPRRGAGRQDRARYREDERRRRHPGRHRLRGRPPPGRRGLAELRRRRALLRQEPPGAVDPHVRARDRQGHHLHGLQRRPGLGTADVRRELLLPRRVDHRPTTRSTSPSAARS